MFVHHVGISHIPQIKKVVLGQQLPKRALVPYVRTGRECIAVSALLQVLSRQFQKLPP